MSEELKPCPFCGGEADPEGWMNGDGECGPECESCGATASSVVVWNHRAELAALKAGHGNQDGCNCQGCGVCYTADLLVPDDAWEKIKPKGKALGAGLLCPNCIMSRLAAIGWSAGHLSQEAEAGQGEAVAVVNCGDEGYWADILPNRSVHIGQMLYTAPPASSDARLVPVGLLERVSKADASIGANAIQLADGWKAMAELRALLAQSEPDEVRP